MMHITDETLKAYLDGTLDAAKEMEVMEHIASCDCCAGRFADMLAGENMVTPPPDLKSGILEQTVYRKGPVQTIQKLQERKRAKQKEFLGYAVKVGVAMAASVLMVISMSDAGRVQSRQALMEQGIAVEAARENGVREYIPKESEQREKETKKKKQISGSLQKVSGKMGDTLFGILDVFGQKEKKSK